ncbi:poly(glycerol-phosphate) alpha-glucosyltransferase, partial [Mammaliicoccus sciuri]|nr:poly(glycerol-phosphate) alpha-glucosyltransferase [Mammaliicoccus sciuri]
MEISNQLKNLFNSNSDLEKIFVSVGHPSQKAIVKMFKAHNAERNIKKYIESFRKNTGKNAEWIKID